MAEQRGHRQLDAWPDAAVGEFPESARRAESDQSDPAEQPDAPLFADTSPVDPDDDLPHRGRKGRRAALIGGVIGALLVGTGLGYALTRGGSPPAAKPPPAPSTATVTRTDLVNTQQEPGTLGYVGSYTVVGQSPPSTGTGGGSPGGTGANPGGTGSPGSTDTLTWLPSVGSVVQQGQELYGVDGHTVPLLYGSTPLYRTLSPGVSNGADVAELNQDLRALGYRQAPSGNVFTAGTETAIKAWQKAMGVAQTGAVNPGDAVFEPSAVVVTAVSANLGASATGPLMTLSGTTKVITVSLPVTAESLAAVGESVQVQLPDGSMTPGHVTSIGTVATAPAAGSGSGAGGGSGSGSGGPTVAVTVSLDNPQAIGNLDGAPVNVNFTSAQHANVLAVPVGALLALAGGGYAIDVVDPDGHTHLVAVTLGMFANGLVEVSGTGVREGLKVEVAGTE